MTATLNYVYIYVTCRSYVACTMNRISTEIFVLFNGREVYRERCSIVHKYIHLMEHHIAILYHLQHGSIKWMQWSGISWVAEYHVYFSLWCISVSWAMTSIFQYYGSHLQHRIIKVFLHLQQISMTMNINISIVGHSLCNVLQPLILIILSIYQNLCIIYHF